MRREIVMAVVIVTAVVHGMRGVADGTGGIGGGDRGERDFVQY
jgi:hypothetical protein